MTAKTVQKIAQDQKTVDIEAGIVRDIRGQYIDVLLDGGKHLKEVKLARSISVIDVGWWVIVVRTRRANKWVAIIAAETASGGRTQASYREDMPQPGSVTATAKPYLIELSWSGSFQDVATYEVQHNTSASETGATTLKIEGSNFMYWCAPGTQRYFRVRAVSSSYERSSWSSWVNATATSGDAYMFLGVNVGATGPEWQAFDWDNISAVSGADMVHGHTNDAEGGVFPWLGLAVTGVPDQQGALAMKSVAGTPSVIGGAGIIYPKDVSGLPELHYLDDAGNEVQITSAGGLPAADHGGLTGLADDDHTQYLLADGSRTMTGTLFRMYHATDHIELRIETDKADGQAQISLQNDAQIWNMGVTTGDQFFIWDQTVGAFRFVILPSTGYTGFGTATPGSITEWNLTTENLEIVDAGSAGATEQAWVEAEIAGVQGYLHVFAAK